MTEKIDEQYKKIIEYIFEWKPKIAYKDINSLAILIEEMAPGTDVNKIVEVIKKEALKPERRSFSAFRSDKFDYKFLDLFIKEKAKEIRTLISTGLKTDEDLENYYSTCRNMNINFLRNSEKIT